MLLYHTSSKENTIKTLFLSLDPKLSQVFLRGCDASVRKHYTGILQNSIKIQIPQIQIPYINVMKTFKTKIKIFYLFFLDRKKVEQQE